MAKQSDSSKRWLKEHFSDPYVKRAQQEGYRSRAVYKLLELQKRDRLFKSGMVVVDLGAAPGGWSQVTAPLIKPNGVLIAVDLLEMEPLPGVEFIQGDFTSEEIFNSLLEKLPNNKADWVLSDMAPNISGNECIDIPRSMYLAEITLEFALQVLNETGGILMKVFQGEGFDSLLTEIKRNFKSVSIRKPEASRARSKELYLLARGRKLPKRHSS